jgi:3-oxoacyl-[acyl-carrier protein] reductase
VTVDVTDPEAVSAAVQTTRTRLGGIDILVNNAGIAGPNHPLWEYPLEAWQQVVEVNLLGTFYCCRAVVPVMLQGGYGRIINIASIAGKEGNPQASAYSASKAGVIALTKSLGKELARHGILVNCLTPAAVETDLFQQMTPEHIQYMLSRIPMCSGSQISARGLANIAFPGLTFRDTIRACGLIFTANGLTLCANSSPTSAWTQICHA